MIRAIRKTDPMRPDVRCVHHDSPLGGKPFVEVTIRLIRFTLCDECAVELGGRLLATDKAMTIVNPDPARAGERP
jgi:hypothetical protein